MRSRAAWILTSAVVVAACTHPTQTARHETTTPASTGGGDTSDDERRLEAGSYRQDQARVTESAGTSIDMEVAEEVPASAERPAEESPPPPVSPSMAETTSVSPAPVDDAMSLSVGSATTSSGSSSTSVELPNIGYPISREPAPIDLVGYAIAPSVPTRVLLGTLELPPGERFVPPVSSCQDTLLYVSSGTLDASGTGIASVDAPTTLYAGDAVRFGPEGDGLVVNNSSEPVRTLVALARSEDGGPARLALDERGDHVLCPDASTSDPLSQPQRTASFATSPPLVVMDGALEVRILLDADAAGAEHAGLAVLTGSPSFSVPEHVHDAAAEILWFEEGSGTMHVGDHDVAIGPGVTVYVPEGTPHSFEPSGSTSLRAVQFYAPSGPEQRFRGMTSP